MTTTFFHACIINTFLWRFQHREYCARRTNSYQSRSSKIFSFVEKCTFETSNILGLFSAAWTHCVKSPNFVQKLIFVFIVFENHIENQINIASEASYVYILSGQKFIKNANNGLFWLDFENLKLAVKQCYQTGQLKGQKLVKNAKIQMRHYEKFLNNVWIW